MGPIEWELLGPGPLFNNSNIPVVIALTHYLFSVFSRLLRCISNNLKLSLSPIAHSPAAFPSLPDHPLQS